MKSLNAFKAYDIRGKVPEDLNETMAYQIGKAFVVEIEAKEVVIGHDIRLESEGLSDALQKGLLEAGANVMDLGLCGTEEIYFATSHYNMDGGIMITASHNPKGYNGLKLVSKNSKPISGDTGLQAIEQRVLNLDFSPRHSSIAKIQPGLAQMNGDKTPYIDHLMSYVDLPTLNPLNIAFNPGNGSASAVIHDIVKRLPFKASFVNDVADGHFPHGVPNPLLPENRAMTSQAVKDAQADFGVAWDGDFDRCFLFDEQGQFIEGYYLVGLLAETLLAKRPGEKIIYDPRLTWNTIEQVTQAGGVPIQSKTGHAFIKERMRLEDAIYGGEMSAHHYFKDFFYCDSGMIPWLLIAQLISSTGQPLSALVKSRMKAYPCSGEINYTVKDMPAILEKVMAHFEAEAPKVDKTDGLGLDFGTWRMNIRGSNTEPLLRLNVETKADEAMVWQKVKEVEALIKSE